jgi:uncharacterized DUF497 family protein
MIFEFDSEKSRANQEKHGIDFQLAQAIWSDADYMEIPLTTSDELRFMVIGRVAGKMWSGIITYRGEAVRIISVRRSRREEIDLYES